ncbi:MAG: L,D-transpeptidase family protein [Flavobacteriales bacterium]|nr:L,D-transpeptidase family protein [Flavobacteriales bacterium]
MRSTPLIVLLLAPLLVACQRPVEAAPARTQDAPAVAGTHVPATRVPLARLLDSLAIPADRVHFRVDKSERKFRVEARLGGEGAKDTVLVTYPCVLGESPEGDKFMQGDRRTPEGTFTFRSKRVHDRWHKFIWIDYPNAESWRRYRERVAQGHIPPGKDIGGEIGIHGVPEGMDAWIVEGVDWTWGCIALKNADVDEIYPYIRPGTTLITIEP